VLAAANVGRDEARLSRFLNEVKVALKVTHSNVCRVYDIGDVDGLHYLSMEYIDGVYLFEVNTVAVELQTLTAE
jgi:serine/threonine protein kinase